MRKNYFLFILAAFLLPFMTIAAQGFGEFPEFRSDMLVKQPAAHKAPKALPNEDKNRGVLMYATSLIDIWRERGWYEIRSNDSENFTKIRTWDPGSGSYVDGLACGSWGGDAYYAYRVLQYDAGYDYPHSFVKVDVKTGELTTVKEFTVYDDLRRYWSKYRLYYMTYDPVKDEIYAFGQTTKVNEETEKQYGVTTLYRISKTDGKHEKIVDLDFISYAMAVDYDGNLWIQTGTYENGVSMGDKLLCYETDNFTLNNEVEAVSLVHDEAPFKTGYYGTMSFDYTTGDLYWMAVSGGYYGSQNLYTVDLETGQMTYKGIVWGDMAGLYIPYIVPENPAVPAAVKNLRGESDINGEGRTTLTWVNPTTQWNRDELTDLTEIKIYRIGENDPIESISVSSDKIGEEMTWVDNNAVDGLNRYYVVPCNSNGVGIKDSIEVYAGLDVPAKVCNITINNQTTSAVISWENAERGWNGGYVNQDELTYTVIRYPDNKVIAEKISEKTVTDNEFLGQMCYCYTIQAFNSKGDGDIAQSEEFIAGEAHRTPVVFDFSKELYSKAWTNLGLWYWSPGVISGDERMITEIKSNPTNWLISPDIYLEAGKRYRFKAVIKTDLGPKGNNYNFKLAVGQGKTASDMKVILKNEEFYSSDEYYYIDTFKEYMNVKKEGVYNFGINVTDIIGTDMFSLMGLTVEEVFDVDLEVVKIKNVVDAIYNKDNTSTVVVFNNGNNKITDYKVQIARVAEDGEYVILGETTEVPEIEPEGTVEISVKFRPDLEEDMNIVGIVDVDGDGNQYNNITEVYPLLVLPEDFVDFNKTITNESSLENNTRIPISFCAAETMTQSIYKAEELDVAENSRIQRISYMYDGNDIPSVLGPVSVKVYMCNTEKETYSSVEDAIPVENMKLVWDGEVSVNPGKENYMTFFLSEEFVYAKGMNLCIAFRKSGSLGEDYPALFKVFTEPQDITRTIISDGVSTTYWELPVLRLALVEDPEAVGLKTVTVAPKVWFDNMNSTLNFEGEQVENVVVYDISGKLVDMFDVAEGVESVTVSLPSGIYLVRSTDVEGNVNNVKVNIAK